VTPEKADAVKAVVYPESDGKPMGETDCHRDEIGHYAIDVLDDHFRDDPDVYVSGNNFIYYTKGEPQDVVSPDCYVVRGVEKRRRRTFKVWEENAARPSFVLEVTSRSTRREDMGDKMAKYRDDLGVREYFIFDPFAEWIPEKLRGYTLRKGVYEPLNPAKNGRIPSRELGLEVAVSGGHLRFFEPKARAPLPTRLELIEQLEKKKRRR